MAGKEREDQRGAWFVPCHTACQEQSLDKDPGFPAASPSYSTVLGSGTYCPFLLDCPPLSLLQNVDVTFRTQQAATSPRSLPRWSPETPLVAEHGLRCIFSTVFCSLLSPQKTVPTLTKNSKLSTRGRHLLRKSSQCRGNVQCANCVRQGPGRKTESNSDGSWDLN